MWTGPTGATYKCSINDAPAFDCAPDDLIPDDLLPPLFNPFFMQSSLTLTTFLDGDQIGLDEDLEIEASSEGEHPSGTATQSSVIYFCLCSY